MSKIAFCQACSNEKFGVKTRMAIEHTCERNSDVPSTEKIFKDLIHGFTAKSKSKNTAWMLIRNKCHELKLEVPTFDKIIEVE